MGDTPYMSVYVGKQMQREDYEALSMAIGTCLDVQKPQQREFGAEWVFFVALMKDVGIVAGGSAAVVKLANEILAWRDRMRSKRGSTRVRLRRPGASELNLEKATDEEVREWFCPYK